MTCDDLRHDQLLDPPTPELRVHLGSCGTCRARRDELQSLGRALSHLGQAEASAKDPALVRRILSTTVQRPRRFALRRRSLWPWAAAAAAALIATLLWPAKPARTPDLPVASIPEAPRETPPPVEPPVRPPPPRPELPVPVPLKTPTPTPPPAPAPLPEPQRPEPPLPVTPPIPLPPTRPAPAQLALADVSGTIDLDGKKAQTGTAWIQGAALQTAARPGRFTLPDGTRITLGRSTLLRAVNISPPELALEDGMVFVEVIPGGGRRFAISTPDARIRVTGTRFGVRLVGHTEIVVAAGEVAVANDKGSATLPAGTALAARKGTAPGKPKAVDVDALSAWSRELDGPERVRLRYDFEDGKLATAWTSGKTAAGPARGLNRLCLEGGPGVDADLTRIDRRLPVMNATLELRFRYWTSNATQVRVQLFSDRVRDNFRYDVKDVGHGKWEQVRIPFASLFLLADGSHPQDGERFSWFNLTAAGADGPVYFDDIEFVELLR